MTVEPRTIEQVLADARGELPVLRKHGQDAIADAIEQVCNDVATAAEPFTRWLSEPDAVLRSTHAAPWFRQRFRAWERQGLARQSRAGRQYLSCIVPERMRLGAVKQDATRAARGEESAA